MDPKHWLKILILLCLLAFSAFFSATETAFLGANKSRLKTMADKGNKRAQKVLFLIENYDKLLSTILVGNNIVNITASSVSTLLFVNILKKQDLAATVSTAVLTVAILIFGEISPKSLATEAPERFAMAAAPFVLVLCFLLTPINALFSLWKKMLKTVFHISKDGKVTDDELLTMIEEAEQDGGIGEQESELLKNVIAFEDREASEIITPRVDIIGVEENESKEEIAKTFRETGFSRLPVFKEDLDHMEGVIHMKDFYARVFGSDAPLSSIINPIVTVPESVPVSKLLKLLQKEKSHMAAVLDEYGGLVGIVTMEDILEELVGEIWDEHDEIVEAFEDLGNGAYRVLCSTDLGKMYRFFGIKKERTAAAVGGWVVEQLGKIPEQGDRFVFDGLSVTVSEAEDNRAVAVIIRPDKKEGETS